ncbi:MAG TPA: glycine zipper 2TM domain-containing protein [Gammaproteobacteria bacterium]|nr:glycine zipper 2TM domain-containing protein [Gammaproteobacteria bacterium]
MKTSIFITALSLSLLLCGCTQNQREASGIVGGAAVGGVVGNALTGGSTAGTVVGAALGGLAGDQIAK